MKEYTVISVDSDLLPQVLRELFAVANNPDLVEVNESDHGRVIHAHPEVAETWYQQVVANGHAPEDEKPEVVAIASNKEVEQEKVVAIATTTEAGPVKRGPGRPRKEVTTSASNGEEPK
jgi:hypothetical protein